MLRVGLFVQSLSLRKITECIEYKHHSIRRFKGVKGTKNVESDCVSFWGDSFGSGDVPIWVVGAAAGGANSVRCDDIRRLLTMYLCMLYIVFIVLPLWRNTDSQHSGQMWMQKVNFFHYHQYKHCTRWSLASLPPITRHYRKV